MADATPRCRSILSRPSALAGLGLAAIALGTLLLLHARIPPPVPTVVPAMAVPGAGLGTPIARAGLVVTLVADAFADGPVSVGVDVRDAGGTPVSGATVILTASSLDMRMEAVVAAADAKEPGHYGAALDLDMAGLWEVTALVTLPGGATALFTYVLSLGSSQTSNQPHHLPRGRARALSPPVTW